MTNYPKIIKRLFNVNLFGGIKLGLENCVRLNQALDFPSQAFTSIHIAGTNGKGSVVTKIASALQESGLRVGLYTSPHISCFRERIRINDEMISEDTVERLLTKIFTLAEQLKIPATFFEFTTLLAFAYFAEQNVDIAVVETGLGGRLDATNIVKPKLTAITSISLEHTEILGTTLEEIAREKGGIIKTGVPVVIGPRVPKRVIRELAHHKKSQCIEVTGNFVHFDDENQAIAKACLNTLNINPQAIQKGLEKLPPCRIEILTYPSKHHLTLFPKAIILDVAHNPDGIAALLAMMDHTFPGQPIRTICGLSKNKDLAGCLKLLKKRAIHFHLVEAVNGRGASVSSLEDILLKLETPKSTISIAPTIASTVAQAVELAAHKNEIVLACGTFFIMSDIRAALGIQEPRDPIDINERI
jgi:dihydrofolate synthase / folylpolyglutamate synthase